MREGDIPGLKCLGGEAGWNPRWDSVVSGSPASQEQGCLSAAEFPGIGAGKLAENHESRCGISAWCCHKMGTAAQSRDCFPGRGPAKDRSLVRLPPSPGRNSAGVRCRCPWNLVLKFSRAPEIKTLGHRPGEHRVRMETEETRVTAFLWRLTEESGARTFSSGARER